MKKYLFLLVFTAFLISVSCDAQTLFGRKKVQDGAVVSRVYVWDIPRTDSLFLGVLPPTQKVILAYTAKGLPVYMITGIEEYESIKNYFYDSLYNPIKGFYLGFEFAVSYLEKVSWLSNAYIKNLPVDKQLLANAMNTKQKYLLIAEGTKSSYGKKNSEDNPIPLTQLEIQNFFNVKTVEKDPRDKEKNIYIPYKPE